MPLNALTFPAENAEVASALRLSALQHVLQVALQNGKIKWGVALTSTAI